LKNVECSIIEQEEEEEEGEEEEESMVEWSGEGKEKGFSMLSPISEIKPQV